MTEEDKLQQAEADAEQAWLDAEREDEWGWYLRVIAAELRWRRIISDYDAGRESKARDMS